MQPNPDFDSPGNPVRHNGALSPWLKVLTLETARSGSPPPNSATGKVS